MKVTFWGVRGSLPTPQRTSELTDKLREVLTLAEHEPLSDENEINTFISTLPFYLNHNIGGNTTCVSFMDNDDNIFVVDAGTGLRNFGLDLIKNKLTDKTIHIFFTHFHWDHIQGFPFFIPAYIPNTNIKFYSIRKNFEKVFQFQQNKYCFPVFLDDMPANKEFITIRPGSPIKIGNTEIDCLPVNHPGGGTAYSFTEDNKKVTITGDVEFQQDDIEHMEKFNDFFTNSELAIFDAQYTLEESFERFDWGHTTYTMAVNLAIDWNIKRLALTHFDPNYSDKKICEIQVLARDHVKNLQQANQSISDMDIFSAYEGLIVEI